MLDEIIICSPNNKKLLCGQIYCYMCNFYRTFNLLNNILGSLLGKTEEEARQFMETLVKEDRYLEDAWA